LKEKISNTPALALLNLQQPFEIETDASGYTMGEIFVVSGKSPYRLALRVLIMHAEKT
jgi:hypothetical protein